MKNVLKITFTILFLLAISASQDFTNYEIYLNNNDSSLLALNVSKIKNLAIFIEFSDSYSLSSSHLDDEESVKNAYNFYNSEKNIPMQFKDDAGERVLSVPSFKKYWENESYGKLLIDTDIFPKENGVVKSYVDKHPLNYYLSYDASSNILGYKTDDEKRAREYELIENALAFCKKQIEDTYEDASIFDTDKDGKIDAISFIVEVPEETILIRSSMLWAHKSSTDSVNTKLFDKRLFSYNLLNAKDYKQKYNLFSTSSGTYGTLMHEFAHTLGYQDLYTTDRSNSKPIGFFDIMGNYSAANPPSFLTYFTTDFNGFYWHSKLEEINSTTKNITLSKPMFVDPNEKRAVKVIGANKDEHFIIEYHDKKDTYPTSSVDASGIIVYRINEKTNDISKKVYIFRPNETVLGEGLGDLTKATLNTKRPSLGTDEKTSAFNNLNIHYSDGSNSRIIINVIGQDSDSLTFDVIFPNTIGDGTKENPYLISNVEDYLYYMNSSLAKSNNYFKLMNDLDFSNITNYPSIDFTGYFDGNGKKLKNITSSGYGVFNFLGEMNKSTVIENLIVDSINVLPGSGSYLGGLANVAEDTVIKNVEILGGKINNKKGLWLQETGGLLGTAYSSVSIFDCKVSASVSSTTGVGGLIGLNQNISIKNSLFSGLVSGDSNVGMVIGSQSISEGVYNIPDNVYYEYKNSEQKKYPAVGGIHHLHNLDILGEKNLSIGLSEIVSIKSIDLETREITLKKGESKTLKAKVLPDNTTMDKNLTWKIEKEEIASVQNGVIVGKKAGRTSVTVSSVNGITEKITLVVNEPIIPIEKISFNVDNIELYEGENYSLNVSIFPTNTTMDKKITWISSNTSVATVNNGVIKTLKQGVSTITATSINGCVASINIIVKKQTENISESEILKSLGVEKKNGFVFGFSPHTDISKIRSKILSFSGVQLKYFNKNNTSINSGILTTGMKYGIIIDKDSYDYTIIIRGDVDKDGEIYPTDYVKIRNYIMGKTNLDAEAMLAADVDGDGEIFATDYVRIRNHIMGNGNIIQK